MVPETRPERLSGLTIKVKTGCGNLYVTINGNGKPIEVFCRLGKAGGCSTSQTEALGRSVTLGLKYGIPVEEYIKELKGISCSSPHMWPENERALSCSDAIAIALQEWKENGLQKDT